MSHDTTKGHKDAQGLGLPSVAMQVSNTHSAMAAMLILVARTATWGHGVIQTQATA